MKKRVFAVVASVSLAVISAAAAASFTEDFSTDPFQNGWKAFGNTNLFEWDAARQELAVTWDSTQPNSFFYRRLDGYLTRYDDFTFAFDLRLTEAASDVEPNKPLPLQIGIGFQNYSVATNADYLRGYLMVSDIVEFNYYPTGAYDLGDGTMIPVPAHCVPSFVSSHTAASPSWLNPYYVLELPTNEVIHVTLTYTASNQTAVLTMTTNGSPVGVVPPLVLDSPTNSNFTASENYRVDMFSISSYTSIGDDYDSIFARGTVANLQVILPPPAQNLTGAFSNGVWQVQFANRTNWVYTLERTQDFAVWHDASAPVAGNGTTLLLEDATAPAGKAFYRVRADRP